MSERNLERTVRLLEENAITFVCVEAPQGVEGTQPPLEIVTSEIAVIRFHGSNRDTWERRTRTSAERFDYYYDQKEFGEWTPRIRKMAEQAQQVHALMNTNRRDQGPVNAVQLALALESAGLDAKEPRAELP